MVALGDYAKAHAIPPMDRGLRSIVVQQIGNLLKGGWPMEEIKAQALSIFSRYDRFNGHRLMTQLQRTMELSDEDRQYQAHKTLKDSGFSIDPEIARTLPSKAMPESRLKHPNNHAFEWDSSTSCRICGGPPGVHVRRVSEVVMNPRDEAARSAYLSQVQEAFIPDPEQNLRGLPAAPTGERNGANLYKSKAQRSGGVAGA